MLNKKQRATLAEKLMDAGNIAAGALVFAPFLSTGEVSIAIPAVGLMLTVVFYLMAIQLLGDQNDG